MGEETRTRTTGQPDTGDRAEAPWPPPSRHAPQHNFIGDRYRIDGLIHETLSSFVYKAFDTWRNRHIALKEIKRPVECDDEEWKELLLRFEQSTEIPKHPNILEARTEIRDDIPFIKMELVEGGDLDDRIYGRRFLDERRQPRREPRPTPPSLDEIRRIMDDVFRALEFLHKQGIVHRDLKPGNILRAANDCWKLTDFGIARFESSSGTRYGAFMGTLLYSPPEQLRGETVDERADIYSCGVVLYELLAGQRPFRGSEETIRRKIEEGRALAPSLLPTQFRATNDPRILEKLDRVVMRAMARDREDRYPSIAAFREDLHAALDGAKGATVRREDKWDWKPPPPPEPNRGWLTAASVLLLLAGVGAVGYRFYPDIVRLFSSPPAPVPAPVAPPAPPLSTPVPLPAPVPLPGPSPSPPITPGPSDQPSDNPTGHETGTPDNPPPGPVEPPVPVPNPQLRPEPPSDSPVTPVPPTVLPHHSSKPSEPGRPQLHPNPPPTPPKPPRPLPGPQEQAGRDHGATPPQTGFLEPPPAPNPAGVAHDTGILCQMVAPEALAAMHLSDGGAPMFRVIGVTEGSVAKRGGVELQDLIQATAGIAPKLAGTAVTSCQAYTPGPSGGVSVRLWRNGEWLTRRLNFP